MRQEPRKGAATSPRAWRIEEPALFGMSARDRQTRRSAHCSSATEPPQTETPLTSEMSSMNIDGVLTVALQRDRIRLDVVDDEWANDVLSDDGAIVLMRS